MTAGTSAELASLLRGSGDQILDAWSGAVVAELGRRSSPAEVRRELAEILDALTRSLEVGDSTDLSSGAYAEVRALLAELSRTRARQGSTPRDTALGVLTLKRAALQALGPELDGKYLHSYLALADLVDDLGLFTFETYAAAREQVIVEQAEQLLELSTPVVKLWDGILAVPLVGTLDSARTQVVMEQLLQALVDTGSECAIIDITGVPAVDTQVAQHLLKTVVAARLMGAECVVSGIRPQIAQTIVTLGIEFGDIATKASLADALVLALKRSGVEMTRRARA
ncbi:MAG TPA: STAS domain-containing protein [Mycobacteriales bacterium]|nr:STAS domain-containing protein [Mycobacteriales bacterium]